MNIVEVKFDYNNTTNYFKCNGFSLKKNLTVIVNTEKGYQFGKVVQIVDDSSFSDKVDLGEIVRISTKKDYLHYLDNVKCADVALVKCKEIVNKNGLNMTILDACYNFDKSQLLFRFIADERIDFRDLAKELGSTFKTRIELRQIGIRDKAKQIGGIGPCGRLLCCSSFLRTFDSVTINMAKNQNVSLNPSKINGVCGRLLCCLKYENDVYTDIKKKFPKVGSLVSFGQGEGKVVSIDVVKNKYVVELDDKKRIELDINDSKK